ncbi:MAG: response regulator [Planctomycetes bacterium]|nr:response regulator [Planctomycetota bacterium]
MRDGKPVILYIDDDRDMLDGMRVQLEARGHIMVDAQSGEDGVRAFGRESPDLVLVDLMMEEVDAGTRVVRELRLTGNQVPIVMLTSVGDSFSMSADAESLGLAAILQKPVDPRALDALIRAKIKKPA